MRAYSSAPIRRTSTEVVFGIVQEQKEESHQRLDHDFEDVIAWSAEPDPSFVTGDHDVASQVRDAYRLLRGKIVGDDWSSLITAYLESHDAARMRGDGRVYWVPPQRIDEVKQLGSFLAEVGIDLILCEIEPEVQIVVSDVAQVSIDEELDRLQEEADAFEGKQKPSTYARRLEEYLELPMDTPERLVTESKLHNLVTLDSAEQVAAFEAIYDRSRILATIVLCRAGQRTRCPRRKYFVLLGRAS